MDWLSVAALGIIWAVILLPAPRRRAPVASTAKIFPVLTRNLEVVTENTQQPGRWVLAPRKGSRFVGSRERARRRARDRRRRIVVVLLEAIAVTALIGLFPPLRGMLLLTAVLAFLLVAYLGLIAYVVASTPEATVVRRASESEFHQIRVLTPPTPVEFPHEPPRVRVASR